MWIEIDKSVFENSDFKGLNYLFQILSWYPTGSRPRYNLFVNSEAILNTKNYKLLSGIENEFKEFIDSEFDRYVTESGRSKKRDYTISYANKVGVLNIEEAIRFFNQPISIILENNKNDAYFIKAIIYHFDEKGIAIEHLKNGWIRFENAGGCSNIKNFIEGELKIFDDLASRNNKVLETYFRGLVIIDSDKSHNADNNKPQHTVLKNYLSSKNIDFHFLTKRMMENYMPDEVFEELESSQIDINLKAWISVYRYLTDEQKDYLNIYSGFSKELDLFGSRKPIDPAILSLYAISTTNFNILDKGFKYPDFKNSFSELFFKSTRINKHTLKYRANSTELQDILDKIYKLL